jgi:hypothetical protein
LEEFASSGQLFFKFAQFLFSALRVPLQEIVADGHCIRRYQTATKYLIAVLELAKRMAGHCGNGEGTAIRDRPF